MKSLFKFTLSSLLLTFTLTTSCTKENLDTLEVKDIPAVVDTVVVSDPIAFTVSSISQSRVSSGAAYYGINGDTRSYVLASDNVDVECPGGLATSFDGGEDYFQFHFIQTPTVEYVFLANFNTIVDDREVTLFSNIPPTCMGDPFEIDYQIDNNRITGSVSGEFFYPNSVYVPPFENCENWISTGIVDVSFDLPLVKCFEF